MGENNTAALDPIFFFHHCFIDYTFWTWQRRWNLTKRGQLTVDWGYAGTNSSDGGGAPAYQVANAFIDMDTPLYPFRKEDKSWFTSNDVTNIEELGYSYFHEGSLEPFAHRRSLLVTPQVPSPAKVLRVSGINRLKYEGSFVVRTIVMKDGEEYEVGRDPILSRWKVQGCLNCQNHLEVKSYVPIHQEFLDALGGGFEDEGITVEARVQTHGHRDGVRTAMRMGRDKPQQPVVEVL